MSTPKQKFKAYMCTTDFSIEWKLNPQAQAPEIYKTITGLKKDRSCWRECGITEVEVLEKRTVVKGKL